MATATSPRNDHLTDERCLEFLEAEGLTHLLKLLPIASVQLSDEPGEVASTHREPCATIEDEMERYRNNIHLTEVNFAMAEAARRAQLVTEGAIA